jgi:hypothetical protein
MDPLPVILQLVSGIACGNIAGSGLHRLSLGGVGNSLVGFAGGALGGHALQSMCGDGFNPSSMQIFLSSVAGGAFGGAIMVVLVGLISASLHRRS